MRILLIKPKWYVGYGQVRYGKGVRFPNLSLGIIAALSPGHDVKVVDANWQRIPYDERFDLVGITSTTFTADDAYEIAGRFRERGTPVVLGGVHPTLLSEEALQHVDAVVVGEAEYVWKDVLRDAEKGTLRGVYQADRPTDMADVPFPRRDLLNEHSWFTAVEASRGCPNRCRYCYLPETPWAAFRPRPVEHVVAEVESLRQNLFIFVDDNLFADRDHALRLFRAITPLKKSWLIQGPTTIGKDEELLDAMAESGCFNVQLGFQSVNEATLATAGVDHNRVHRYRELVEKLHRRNIIVTGYFVFGFDTDRPDVFESTARAIRELEIDDVGMFIVTPFPGTSFHRQYEREGRLLPGIGSRERGWTRATFQPKHMTPAELEQGAYDAYDSLQWHFRRRLLWALRTQWRMLARNPIMVPTLVVGNIRHGGPTQDADSASRHVGQLLSKSWKSRLLP